jgi:lipopolysaccharide export system permease protein
MTIFERTTIKEYATTLAMLLLILVGIVLVTQLVKYLGQAASGQIPIRTILAFILLSTGKYLSVLIVLSAFLSVFLSVQRAYRQSEMNIWFSSGLSISGWLKPAVTYAIPLVLLTAFVTLVVSPWAEQRRDLLRSSLEQKDDISVFRGGVFIGSRDGTSVFFINEIEQASKNFKDVFVFSEERDSRSVTLARQGHQESTVDGLYVVLENGSQYKEFAGGGGLEILDFDRYAVRQNSSDPSPDFTSASAQSISSLLSEGWSGSKDASAEIASRLSYPLSLLFLIFLCLPLAYQGPRSKRSFSIGNAILLFFIYQNLIAMSQLRIASGTVSFFWGLALPHIPVLFVFLVWVCLRTNLASKISSWYNQR